MLVWRILIVSIAGMERRNNTYSHDTKNSVGSSSNGVACAALRSREDLRSIAVEHSIHDVAAEVIGAVPAKKRRAALGGCRAVQENASQNGRNRECALAADSRQFNEQATNQCSWNTQDGNDQAVAVSEICAPVAKVDTLFVLDKRQKRVVKREAWYDY